MAREYWKAGGAWGICDRCGQKFRHADLRKEWNGLMVCREDYDPRHPQEGLRGIKENTAVRDARPPQPDNFLTANEVTWDDL